MVSREDAHDPASRDRRYHRSARTFLILVVCIHYQDAASEEYLLPVADRLGHPKSTKMPLGWSATEAGAGKAWLTMRCSMRRFTTLCWKPWRTSGSSRAARACLRYPHTRHSRKLLPLADEPSDSFVSRAEQSNTSIIYPDKFILKLFRKLEPGVNPDVEIGRFLTSRGFRHTPAVYGSLSIKGRSDAEPHSAGILQQFVANRGDAWKYTLESLSEFFTRVLAGASALPPERPHSIPSIWRSARRAAGCTSIAGRVLRLRAPLGNPYRRDAYCACGFGWRPGLRARTVYRRRCPLSLRRN